MCGRPRHDLAWLGHGGGFVLTAIGSIEGAVRAGMAGSSPTRCTHLLACVNRCAPTRWRAMTAGASAMPPSIGRFGDTRRQSVGTDLLARLVEVGQSGVS